MLPRLKLDEVAALKRACDLLAGAGAAMNGATWQGAPSCFAIISEVHAALAGVFNRAEPAYLRILELQRSRAAERTSASSGPGEQLSLVRSGGQGGQEGG